MALKITIQGEVFSFEPEYPLHEAIEIEDGLGMSFGRWQEGLVDGSARARAGLAWVVLRRAGRGVPLADIVSGKFPLTTGDMMVEEEGEQPPGPPAGSSATTSGDGSPSSPALSDTPPPTSASSPSTSSTT